jgi:hypothetical protein
MENAGIADLVGIAPKLYPMQCINGVIMKNLLDDDVIFSLHTMRDRRMLIDAIMDIEKALNNPNHGALDSDLYSDIKSIIRNLKSNWKGGQ